MGKYLDKVQDWYDGCESDLCYDNRLFYLIELFQDLKEVDLQKEDLPIVGKRVLALLDQDFIDESIHMLHQRRIAEEVNYAYRSSIKNPEEVIEEVNIIEEVKPIDDDDIYTNLTSEPDIDLRGADLGDVKFDEEFIKELGL